MEKYIGRDQLITEQQLVHLYENAKDMRDVIEALIKNEKNVPEKIQSWMGCKVILMQLNNTEYLGYAGPNQQESFSREESPEMYEIAPTYSELLEECSQHKDN